MKPYADTNFLTRCYLLSQELPAPQAVLEPLRAGGGVLPIHWLHRLEVANAFEQHAFWSFDDRATRLAALVGLKTLGRTVRA